MRTIARGGAYVRVADPSWRNPLDGGYSQRVGGRWNARGAFPVVYLCRSVSVARATRWSRSGAGLCGIPRSVPRIASK